MEQPFKLEIFSGYTGMSVEVSTEGRAREPECDTLDTWIVLHDDGYGMGWWVRVDDEYDSEGVEFEQPSEVRFHLRGGAEAHTFNTALWRIAVEMERQRQQNAVRCSPEVEGRPTLVQLRKLGVLGYVGPTPVSHKHANRLLWQRFATASSVQLCALFEADWSDHEAECSEVGLSVEEKALLDGEEIP